MKVFIAFNAYASSYEVSDGASRLGNIEGVNSVETLEKAAGETPRYCIVLDIDDATAEETGGRVKAALEPYLSYMNDMIWGAYKKI